ncbi:MAG TPA: helix-turn-helix transcriptional regulator [Opitutales bacterium]|nr:helix-turn-helix transcriptional regulator [Opitutales bacterium]
MPSGIPNEALKPELVEFGNRLRRVRNQAGLTQEKLAERAQLAARTVQKIEAGEINILLTTTRRLREALKCDWNELLG